VYEWWPRRFVSASAEADALTVRRFFADLQERGMSASTIHQAYRTLKTFLLFAQRAGAGTTNPLSGFHLRMPKTLPQVPTEDEVRAVLVACTETAAGKRNRAMMLIMADAVARG
jgi:site-specific recombinase XerD